MSRSRRKTPIMGLCGNTEKMDKRNWHKRMRRKTREAICRGDEVMPDEREVSNPWDMMKDGKRYFGGDEYETENMRK